MFHPPLFAGLLCLFLLPCRHYFVVAFPERRLRGVARFGTIHRAPPFSFHPLAHRGDSFFVCLLVVGAGGIPRRISCMDVLAFDCYYNQLNVRIERYVSGHLNLFPSGLQDEQRDYSGTREDEGFISISSYPFLGPRCTEIDYFALLDTFYRSLSFPKTCVMRRDIKIQQPSNRSHFSR